MKDNGKVVAALLAGLAAGAALGILFAPEKGNETRDRLNDSLKDLGDALKERSAEQIEHFKELTDKVVSTLKTKIKKEESAIEDTIEEHA